MTKQLLETKNLQTIEESVSKVQQEITQLSDRLQSLKHPKKSKKKVKDTDIDYEGAKSRLQDERELENYISTLKLKIQQLELAKQFKVGDWVTRTNTKLLEAGIIRAIRVDKDNHPVFDVFYDKSSKLEKQYPSYLRFCNDEELNYFWHDKKIVRKIDRFECQDPAIVQKFLDKANVELTQGELFKNLTKNTRDPLKEKIGYCKNRLVILGESKIEHHSLETNQLNCLDRLANRGKQAEKLIDKRVDEITLHPDCQQREQLDEPTLTDYTELLIEGGKLKPIKVKFDGRKYWLYDGFHTIEAHKRAKIETISVEVEAGKLRDAILASCGVNSNHGLRRSKQTKENAVITLLNDSEWKCWSNREIARRCKVSHSFVNKLRNNLTGNVSSDNSKNPSNLTGSSSSENPKNQNLTGEFECDNSQNLTVNVHSDQLKNSTVTDDNTRKYINKYGQEATMDTSNIGKSKNDNIIPFPNPNEIKEGMLVQLNLKSLEGVSDELKNINHSYCKVLKNSEDMAIHEILSVEKSKQTYTVKTEDLTPVKEISIPVNAVYSPKEYFELMQLFGSRDNFKDAMHYAVNKEINERKKQKLNERTAKWKQTTLDV